MTSLRVVRAEGDGLARGSQIGVELRDLIQRSVDFYHRYLDRRGVSSEQLQDLLTPYLVASETAYPDMMSVLKGMAVGALVPVLELFAINAFEELEPLLESPEGELLFLQRKEGYLAKRSPPERCSSVSVRTSDGRTLLGHNEHWLAGDAGNVAVVLDRPPGGRVSVASPTVVCCLPAVGINGHGTAQGIGSLTAADDGVGVPRVLVSRSALEARDRSDALARAAMRGRAGGYGHVFAFADGDAVILETSGREHRAIDGDGPHTNHYQSDLASLAPAPSEGSVARLERLRELLAERPVRSAEDLMEIMRDHRSSPQAICLHADPDEGDEASACMFSMVADPAERRMWVAPGNPCEQPYEEIDLTGVRA
ncbi:MAG TPA: C45 family peptidase [Actinomycetota bacterium]|nr:C45 family peptidase [Actinomycetota bacterium]